jgi:hypothetical protein
VTFKFILVLALLSSIPSCDISTVSKEKNEETFRIVGKQIPQLKLVTLHSATVNSFYGAEKVEFDLSFSFLKLNDSVFVLRDWREVSDTLVFFRTDSAIVFNKLANHQALETLFTFSRHVSVSTSNESLIFSNKKIELTKISLSCKSPIYELSVSGYDKLTSTFVLTSFTYDDDNFITSVSYSNDQHTLLLK